MKTNVEMTTTSTAVPVNYPESETKYFCDAATNLAFYVLCGFALWTYYK